jgi:hypothetical protein
MTDTRERSDQLDRIERKLSAARWQLALLSLQLLFTLGVVLMLCRYP